MFLRAGFQMKVPALLEKLAVAELAENEFVRVDGHGLGEFGGIGLGGFAGNKVNYGGGELGGNWFGRIQGGAIRENTE
jgi:hypothetical protein